MAGSARGQQPNSTSFISAATASGRGWRVPSGSCCGSSRDGSGTTATAIGPMSRSRSLRRWRAASSTLMPRNPRASRLRSTGAGIVWRSRRPTRAVQLPASFSRPGGIQRTGRTVQRLSRSLSTSRTTRWATLPGSRSRIATAAARSLRSWVIACWRARRSSCRKEAAN